MAHPRCRPSFVQRHTHRTVYDRHLIHLWRHRFRCSHRSDILLWRVLLPASHHPPPHSEKSRCSRSATCRAFRRRHSSAGSCKKRAEAQAVPPRCGCKVEKEVIEEFAVCILVCLLIVGVVSIGSKSAEIDRLRSELEDSYHEGYEVGYAEGESHGYNVGVEAVLDDVDYYSCFSAGYDAGFVTGQSDLSFPPDAVERVFQSWLEEKLP